MNRPTLQTITEILCDLVAGYVENRDAIKIAYQTAPGTAYWMMRVAPVDDPKAIGKDGAHARAIATLIDAWGAAAGEVHTFRLLNNRERVEQEPREISDAMTHDIAPQAALLVRILAELELDGYSVAPGPGSGIRDALTFELAIRVASQTDKLHLTLARPATGLSVVAALGTLFRAIGRAAGVNIEIAIRQ
jgi:predicted RNA-binding protein YlqC (UPF0109 family)